MTRELSPKASAELIKKAFAARGVKLPHTQALDLIAKMKGFEAWSHYQKASKKRTTPAAEPESKLLPLEDVLREYYGSFGEVAQFPREDWQYQVENGDTSRGYWEWVVSEMLVHEVWSGPDAFELTTRTEVTLPDGRNASWMLEANLTDRWGELNEHAEGTKPGLALLTLDEQLLARLHELMWDEITFVVRKDGKFGLLFEVEYCSIESETLMGANDAGEYKPRAQVVAALLEGLRKLQRDFPEVEMCVPPPGAVICDRPAVWAFMPLDNPLTEAQRDALGTALLSL